jgi:hypothetical protein
MKRLTACLLILFMALCSAPASVLALTESDVAGKSDEELEAENWVTREGSARSKDATLWGLLSILTSTVWQGSGHFMSGDRENYWKLTIMQGASIALMASGLIAGSVTKDDKHVSALWRSLFHFGSVLYATGYLMDVLGTFKGNAIMLPDNHLDPFGQSIDFNIRWLPSDDFNLGLQLSYAYRNPRFWINPYLYANIAEAIDKKLEGYIGTDFGVALWYGERPYTYVAIALDTKYNYFESDAYSTLKFLPYIEFSLDFGSWFDHLANIRFVNRLGIGVQLYDFKYADVSTFSDLSTVLVLESELSINIVKDLNMAFIYRYRPDYMIGQLSSPKYAGKVLLPGAGIFSIDLTFNVSNGWMAAIDMNIGSSIDFWLGISKHF